MKCTLARKLKSEHEKVKDARYLEQFMKCPLLSGRQVCLWCCLHISDIANPGKRPVASEKFPNYFNHIGDETGRDWDSIQSTCSKCLASRCR